MTTLIRTATVADAGLILDFVRELAVYEKLAGEVVATEDLLRDTLFGPGATAEVLIAEADGQAAGFALFFHNYSTFLARPGIYLEDLFVRQQFRGRGVGRALLAQIAHLARERKCGRVEWSVLDWNQPAIRFYQSLGAVPQDQWTTFRLTGECIGDLANLATQPSGELA